MAIHSLPRSLLLIASLGVALATMPSAQASCHPVFAICASADIDTVNGETTILGLHNAPTIVGGVGEMFGYVAVPGQSNFPITSRCFMDIGDGECNTYGEYTESPEDPSRCGAVTLYTSTALGVWSDKFSDCPLTV